MRLLIFVLSALPFFTCFDVCAQGASTLKTILSVSHPKATFPLSALPAVEYQLEYKTVPSLPLLRIPQSYYKKYVIRVLQLDHRSLQQNLFIDQYVYSVKSVDHDGYDYYLSAAFEKKEWGEAFLEQLPKDLRMKAVLVKLAPNDPKCNCFGKF